MSERERVISYLKTRVADAWKSHKDREACDCLRFMEVLEGLSDEEYEATYCQTAEV